MLPAPRAVLFIFNLPFDGLLVLPRRVARALARGASQTDKFFGEFSLGHTDLNYKQY